jgi:hypothetical protein
MDYIGVSGLDIQDSLEFVSRKRHSRTLMASNRSQLKDALTIHFMNIRDADSCFGHDHAEILKDHIDRMTTGRPGGKEASQEDAESPARLAVLPRAISRFAPRATFNPAPNWGKSYPPSSRFDPQFNFPLGLLGKLPREIRDIIYEDVLFHDCSTYVQACTCTKEDRRSKSGIALLRTCGRIHNEIIPLLYESEVFGISLGYEVSFDGVDEETVEWLDPVFYRQTTVGRQTISRLPHNAFRLIQNLELNFTDEATVWQTKTSWNFFASTDRLLWNISEICANLQDSVQLQHLDINLSFCCKFGDIDYMARLLEPIKKLRGINDPHINVCGYQFTDVATRVVANLGYSAPGQHSEPRWGLTDEFTEYLQELLMSPHDTPTPPSSGLEVFEDDHEDLEEYEIHPWDIDEVGPHSN